MVLYNPPVDSLMEIGMRQVIRWSVLVALILVSGGVASDPPYAADSNPLLREVQNTEEYFPDGIGSVWGYVGHTHTERVERIADVAFQNEVTTIGTSNM